jgi:hypothetical protein
MFNRMTSIANLFLAAVPIVALFFVQHGPTHLT